MEDLICMSTKELGRLNVMQQLQNRIIKQEEAAKILSISVRQVRRIWRDYKKEGAKSLISKKRGAQGNHCLPQAVKEAALAFIEDKYPDFGPTLAHEKLVDVHKLKISISSVRNLMVDQGIWEGKKIKRKRVFQLRERRPQEGEMSQIDGSPHAWFEDRGPECTLLVFIDDATGKVKLRFVKAETVFDYFDITKEYLTQYGRPVSFYSDKHGVFRVNKEGALSGNGLTQFGRAMQELGIKLIYANSPQAKGRVERVNRTLQDRLVKELRLRNISSIEKANTYLPTFEEEFNSRFAVIPKNPANAHRLLLPEHNLDQIFTVQQTRHLSKNLTLQYKNIIYQIITDRESYALRKARVMVCEDKEGRISILYKEKPLKYTVMHLQEKQGDVVESKLIDQELDTLANEAPKKKTVPSRDHPWKRWISRKHRRTAVA